jgi:hypothetical protein
MDELKSMARRNNRTQREEILTAKKWLHDWYGIDYHPRVRSMNQAQIDLLEKAQPGSSFDHLYMEVLSRHHFTALAPSTACQVESELTHDQLIRYCSGIVHSQINDIQDMRHMLCDEFSICDYQPTVGLKGRHSGHEGQQFIAGSETSRWIDSWHATSRRDLNASNCCASPITTFAWARRLHDDGHSIASLASIGRIYPIRHSVPL